MILSANYQKLAAKEKQQPKSKQCLKIAVSFIILCVLAGLAVAIGFGIGTVITKRKKAPSSNITSTIMLKNVNITAEEMEGEYYHPMGNIRFHSIVNSSHVMLTITSISDDPILSIIHSVALNMTVMGVNGTYFMVLKTELGYTDYVMPQLAVNMTQSLMMQEGNISNEFFQQFDDKTVNETRQLVMECLAQSKETMLIIETAQALGEMGIHGSEYPAAMQFYLLALQLAKASGHNAENNMKPAENEFGSRKQVKRQGVQCNTYNATCPSYSECPIKSRAYDNDCLGLCGYSCHCWNFVCGDCCVHEYCLTHDMCCSTKGFLTWPCLSAAWNKLESHCSDTFMCE